MVKFTHSPIKEVVIHEQIQVGMDDLLRSRITPSGNMPLYWCDGFLFTFSSMPWTRDIVKDYLEGRVHWAEIMYMKMDKYQPVMMLNDENYKSEMRIRVIDTSSSTLHKEFAKWLKTN